ncbi:MAG: DUF748 domain-containing protein [Planctomycetota bacterium]
MTEPVSAPASPASPASQVSQGTPVKGKSRLWRWLRRSFWIVLLLAVLVRIALPWILPTILGNVAAGYGLVASYERLDLSLLALEMRMQGLTLHERGSDGAPVGEPLAHIDLLAADAVATELLRGRIHVTLAEIDGVDLRIERDADGGMAWSRIASQLRQNDSGEGAAAKSPDTAPSPPAALDLRLPLRLDVLRAQHLRLRVIDHAAPAPIDTWIEANLRADDLGSSDRTGTLAIHARGPLLLDDLAVDAKIDDAEDRLVGSIHGELHGLHLLPIRELLTSIGIEPTAKRIEGRIDGEFELRRDAAAPTDLSATITLRDAHLGADDVPALACRRIAAEIRRLSPSAVDVASVSIEGPTAFARLDHDGVLALLGCRLLPTAAAATPPTEDRAVSPEPSAASSPRVQVDHVVIRDGHVTLADASVVAVDAPPIPLELALLSFEVRDLQIDPAKPDAAATIAAQLRAPQIAESIVLDALVVPFATRREATLDLKLSEVTLARIAPHLARRGLEPALTSAQLDLRVELKSRTDSSGALHADAAIGPISWRDGETLLAELQRIGVAGLRVTPAATRIEEVDIRGARTELSVLADGSLAIAGLHTIEAANVAPQVPRSNSESVAATTSTTPDTATPPRFELGAMRVRGTSLGFVDRSHEVAPGQPLQMEPAELEVDVEDFVVGAATATPSRVRMRVVAPGVAEELAISGTIQSRPGPLDLAVDLELRGNRLTAGPLAGLLQRVGLAPELTAGRLEATLHASAKQATDGALEAHAEVSKVRFTDSDREPFFALDRLLVPTVRIAEGGVSVGRIELDAPRVVLSRDEDGALHAFGMRQVGAATTDVATPGEQSTAAGVATTAESSNAATSAATALQFAGMTVRDLNVSWSDSAVTPPVATTLLLDLTVGSYDNLTQNAPPTEVEARLRSSEIVDQLRCSAKISPNPTDLAASIDLLGEGMRLDSLAGYLPTNIRAHWQRASLRVMAEVRATTASDGAQTLSARLFDVSLADQGLESLALKELRAEIRRPDTDSLLIDALVSEGLTIDTRSNADGELFALGLEFGAAATATAPAPVEGPATAPPPSGPTRLPFRNVALGKLDLGIASLRHRDDAADDPIDVALRIFTEAPQVLLDGDPAALPPIRVLLSGAAKPVFDSLDVVVTGSPWDDDCKFTLDFDASGLHGPMLARTLPAIAERIDASAIVDGRLRANAELAVELRRRDPTDIDLARGFGVDLELRDLEFRGRPDGELLAGIRSVSVEAPRIVPGGDVRIGLIDIAEITARAEQTVEGLRIADIVFRSPPTASESEPPPAAPTPTIADGTTAPAAQGGHRPEVRIEELTVRGLDFRYSDSTCTPPLIAPLEQLDLEVRGFTTRTFDSAVPFRFRASLGAGKVELPERLKSSSLVAGLLGATVGALTGAEDDRALESRVMLDELAIDGVMALGPHLDGKVRANISGFELGALRGIAERSGVKIGDGTLDLGTTVHFLGPSGLRTEARIGFQHLSVSEPAGGPISTYLKLPAPLDAVIFALQDQNNEIAIPLRLRIEEGGVGTGQIATAAITALGKVIADAVAAAPFRAVGMLTGVLGIGGGAGPSLAEQRRQVGFGLGEALPAVDAQKVVAPLIDLLRGDETIALVLTHSFAADDLAHAKTLANPDPELAHDIAARLRVDLASSIRERDLTATRLLAMLGAGNPRDAFVLNRRLHALDAEIARMSDALDRVLALLRSGAERRADRRTRDAATDLARARLESLRDLLLELGGPDLDKRIELRPARITDPIDRPHSEIELVPRVRQPEPNLNQPQVMPLDSQPLGPPPGTTGRNRDG